MQQWSSLLDKVVHQMQSERRNCTYTFVYIPILSHWRILENVVVIDMSVYMSVAERNKCIFYILVLLRGSILRMCSLEMSVKVREFDHDWRVTCTSDAVDFH